MVVEECLKKAFEVIWSNVKGDLLYASSFYRQVWVRDVAISAIALRFVEDPRLRRIIVSTLEFVGKFQSDRGQVPTYIDLERRRIYWYSMDSTLWWVIACLVYRCCDRDAVRNAWDWCYKQVLDDSLLITSMRGTDWMDASIGREGKVLYINVLWYVATKLAREEGLTSVSSREIRDRVNTLFWPRKTTPEKAIEWGAVGSPEFLRDFVDPSREHYIHFVSYEYLDDRFATLANILAILARIADEEKRRRILNYIEREGIDKPYPAKCLYPVMYMPSLAWIPEVDIFRRRSQKCLPYHYHNGGIWPFIGGLYLATLAIENRAKAKEKMIQLAEANRKGKTKEWEFNEWLHGLHAKPMGSENQLWNAATYILAYQATHENVDPRKIFEPIE